MSILPKRLKIYEAIRCFARYLIDQEELDAFFLERIARYKPKRHIPPRKITVDEANIEKLLSVCDTPLDTIIVELLCQTGLRVTEACQLSVEDLDLEKGYLTVRRAKWGKTRRVGLTHRARTALELYLAQRPTCISAKLLVTAHGRSLERYGVRTRLEKLGRRVDVQVTPHALRRAFVTLNANKGRPLVMLQIACGHSDIATTRSYCLTTEDETIQAMQEWN
jgi:integrase/recombinase XerD